MFPNVQNGCSLARSQPGGRNSTQIPYLGSRALRSASAAFPRSLAWSWSSSKQSGFKQGHGSQAAVLASMPWHWPPTLPFHRKALQTYVDESFQFKQSPGENSSFSTCSSTSNGSVANLLAVDYIWKQPTTTKRQFPSTHLLLQMLAKAGLGPSQEPGMHASLLYVQQNPLPSTAHIVKKLESRCSARNQTHRFTR